MKHARRPPCAFTLIELLVVVAIITMLIAILLPSLARAKHTAKLAVCGSNLRQLGTANYTYAISNNQQLPAVGRWSNFQAMMYIMYEFAGGGSPRGFQNLGVLAAEKYVDPHSDIFFCPLQTDPSISQSAGDPDHPNALPNNLPQDMLPDDLAKFGWTNKRAGYLRRNFGEAISETISVQDVGQGPIFADVFTAYSHVKSGHGDSLNVLYGDTHVSYHVVDTQKTPQYTTVGYSTALNPQYEIIWESFGF